MALYYLLNYLVISASRRIDQICTQQLCISSQYSQGTANHAKLPSHVIRACNISSQYKTSFIIFLEGIIDPLDLSHTHSGLECLFPGHLLPENLVIERETIF